MLSELPFSVDIGSENNFVQHKQHVVTYMYNRTG